MRSFDNGFLRPIKDRGSFTPMYWGDGSDGILSEGATYIAGTDFAQYSDFCVKQFPSINWKPETAEILTVDQPCRGLILFVDGNVNIGENATISMEKMGSILPVNPSGLLGLYGDSIQMRHIVDTLNSLQGGAGGDGGNGGAYNGATAGSGGTGGAGRVCQGGLGAGGGGSAGYSGNTGGNGADVIYPDVVGQSGGSRYTTGYGGWNGGSGGAAIDIGDDHPGGAGGMMYGAGPSGGPWGTGATIGGNGEHTGGFILIIAKGNVNISGTLDVSGGAGGSSTTGTYRGGGGGGAGGGVVAVFARGAIDTKSATKTLTGGAGGAGYQSGTTGGEGTYYEEKL